jgi:ribosome modulation factor
MKFELENYKKGLADQTCTLYVNGYMNGCMDRGKTICPWILNAVA